jgi:hypothetical protein
MVTHEPIYDWKLLYSGTWSCQDQEHCNPCSYSRQNPKYHTQQHSLSWRKGQYDIVGMEPENQTSCFIAQLFHVMVLFIFSFPFFYLQFNVRTHHFLSVFLHILFHCLLCNTSKWGYEGRKHNIFRFSKIHTMKVSTVYFTANWGMFAGKGGLNFGPLPTCLQDT